MALVWVVTGCSAGLGREICISALKKGHMVIATSRGDVESRLSELIAQGAIALSLDVTAPFNDIQAFAQKAIGIYGRVDIVCNNAGYLQQGAFEETSPEETLKQYQTAIFGPLNITRAFLPHMRGRKQGVIGMIGSPGSEMSFPGSGLYTSSKAALAAISQTLAEEVEQFNISVTCIEPGFFRTEFLSAPSQPAKKISEYETLLSATSEALKQASQRGGDPRKGGERIVDLLCESGFATETKLPFRVSLGADAHGFAMAAIESRTAILRNWKMWSTGENI